MKQTDIFNHKKDNEYIRVLSNTQFFEIFDKKKIKCEIMIPETILVEKVAMKAWYFNTSKGKSPKVLKKNSDKLNVINIAKHFSFNRNLQNDQYGVIGLIRQKIQNYNLDKNIKMFLRFQNGKFQEVAISEFVNILTEAKNLSTVCLIQPVINCRVSQNEVFYCEYRRDDFRLPIKYRFYKKTLTTIEKKKPQLLVNSFVDYEVELENEEEEKKNQADVTIEKKFFKSFDNKFNKKIQNETQTVVEFIEQGYRIKIRKIVAKFVVSKENVIYFMGLAQMLIDIDSNVIENAEFIKEDLRDNDNVCYFNQLRDTMKNAKTQVFIHRHNVQKEQTKSQFTSKLLNKMMIEKCHGDFCDYFIWNNNQGALAVRQTVQKEYQQHFNCMIQEQQETTVKLPFQISNQLVLRVRETPDQILELLEANKIYHKSCFDYSNIVFLKNNTYDNHKFIKLKKMVDNIEQLYKKVKICKNCFIVYSLAQKDFENGFKSAMKRLPEHYWKTNNLLYQREMENKKPIYEFHGEKLKRCQTSDSGKKYFRVLQLPNVQKDNEQMRVQTQPIVNERVIQKRQNIQSAKPELGERKVKNYIIKKNDQEIQLSRLTLGFLNYSSVKHLYKDKQRIENEESEIMIKKNNVISLFEYFDLKPKINLYKLDEEKRRRSMLYQQRSDKVKQLDSNLEEKQSQPKLISSYYHQNNNYNHLRKLYQFQKVSPLQPFYDEFRIRKAPSVDLEFIVDNMGYEIDQFSSWRDHVDIFVYDEFISIPYTLLGKTTQMESAELFVVFHDIFDSFTEYYHLFNQILSHQDNKMVLFFNIPGQAYSLYNSDKTINNFQISDMLDKLIYQLNQNSQIELDRMKINLIGIGFGGFLLQSFVIFVQETFKNLNQIILINSMSHIDTNLESLLLKSRETFEGCPDNSPQLAYHFYSILMNSTDLPIDILDTKMRLNPINIQGRLFLIRLFMDSFYVKDRFLQLPLKLDVYHSIQNCVINVAHVEELTQNRKNVIRQQSIPPLEEQIHHKWKTHSDRLRDRRVIENIKDIFVELIL